MKLTEFVLTKTIGSNAIDWEYFADVSVTTGWLVKKTVRRQIHRTFTGSWHFTDTGGFTPDCQAEALERAYRAREAFRA